MTTARRAGATSIATLSGLALTVALANGFAPRWVRQSGLDFWNMPSVVYADQTAERESASIKEQQQRLYQEIQLSNNIAEELAAGTLSLKDAVDEMEPIMRNRSGFKETLAVNYGTSSLREGVAHYLVSRVPRSLTHDLVQLSNALYRLEREFESLCGEKSGTHRKS
jgi:hypothetical protein